MDKNVFIGEIRQFAGNFAPEGWALCNGQLLNIQSNTVLYSLIQTTYGGDGRTTFALPNIQGRVPLHTSANYDIGLVDGAESVTLNTQQIPAHYHTANCADTGNTDDPQGNVWAGAPNALPYSPDPGDSSMNIASISDAGGSQPHDNMHPYMAVTYIIALEGMYPGIEPGGEYISELRMFAYTSTALSGWVSCNGQLLSISSNTALYQLLGTIYGGDGVNTFALPDFQGRTPMHVGNQFLQGERGGQTDHTITIAEMPRHTHLAMASPGSPNSATPDGCFWASNTGYSPYSNTVNQIMSSSALSVVGGSQSHQNMAPFIAINICISITGGFPYQG